MSSSDSSIFSVSSSSPRKRQCRQQLPQADSVDDDGANVQVEMSATAATFSDKLGSEIVRIYIGPEEKLYIVHKKLLCNAAEVFGSMFNGGFKEAVDNVAHFPEDNVDAWELFVQWLYQGRLAEVDVESYIKVYCLAETYGITLLMDDAIDSIAQAYKLPNCKPELRTIRYVYAHTREHSALRALMSRWFYHLLVTDAHKVPTVHSIEVMSGFCLEQPDLIHDVFKLLSGSTAIIPPGVQDPTCVGLCTYHQHTLLGDETCPNRKPMSAEAANLLELMILTFPKSRRRFTIDSLSRRLRLGQGVALELAQELITLKKVKWTGSGTDMFLECL